ncbi:hypothetical protein AB0I50_55070, partial [Streptomyces prunicolor]
TGSGEDPLLLAVADGHGSAAHARSDLGARAAQREGTLRRDIEPIEILRLAHGVSTASELADGQGKSIRRYLSLVTDGLRPAAGSE